MEIVSLFVVFERYGWCNLSMLLNFMECKAFAGEVLVCGEIFFLILSSVSTLDIFSLLILKTLIFIEDSQVNKHSYWLTNHRSFHILLLLFDESVNQMH